jgi:hypothetical protein
MTRHHPRHCHPNDDNGTAATTAESSSDRFKADENTSRYHPPGVLRKRANLELIEECAENIVTPVLLVADFASGGSAMIFRSSQASAHEITPKQLSLLIQKKLIARHPYRRCLTRHFSTRAMARTPRQKLGVQHHRASDQLQLTTAGAAGSENQCPG